MKHWSLTKYFVPPSPNCKHPHSRTLPRVSIVPPLLFGKEVLQPCKIMVALNI